jgi:aminopeptidase N
MRIIFLLIFIFCFQFLAFTQNNIDVLHYKFNIGLNDVNDTIHGVAEIKVKFIKPAGVVYFDLTKMKNSGSGMKVEDIEGVEYTSRIQEDEKMNILLPKMFNTGDTLTFIISYSGIPADGLIISKTKYGHRSFFADNWPNRGHNWIPCHDDPADKATVEFIVTAPEHYQVVANGVQVEETSLGNSFKLTHWREDTPISTKVMVIGAADFAVNLAGVVNGNIPVYSWVYPENKDKGFYDYAQANGILEYYISHVGPYGYKKLANVQSKTRFGGLENANTIFYSENSVSGTRKSEGLLAHEIAHQWFGNMATEKSFGHLWLSEGFATYFTILYFENKYGKDTAMNMLREDRSQVIDFSKKSNKAIVDTDETDYMKLLNANSYQKGGWVLHMLRCELGDSVFWRSIRKYYATYAGGVADTRDLQKVFEDVSGKNLKQFFDQWLYTTGQPDLEITWKYDADKILMIDIKQLQPTIFKFPLAFKINTSSGSKKEKVFVDKDVSSYKIKQEQKPLSIIVDPATELLMQSSIKGNRSHDLLLIFFIHLIHPPITNHHAT